MSVVGVVRCYPVFFGKLFGVVVGITKRGDLFGGVWLIGFVFGAHEDAAEFVVVIRRDVAFGIAFPLNFVATRTITPFADHTGFVSADGAAAEFVIAVGSPADFFVVFAGEGESLLEERFAVDVGDGDGLGALAG